MSAERPDLPDLARRIRGIAAELAGYNVNLPHASALLRSATGKLLEVGAVVDRLEERRVERDGRGRVKR